MPRLLLASTSPRRRDLLTEAGFEHDVIDAGVDDSDLMPTGLSARHWAMALAYFKAAGGLQQAGSIMELKQTPFIVLGADTVCVHCDDTGHETLFGKPEDEADAGRMIRAMRNNSHEVVTGVALLCAQTRRRQLYAETCVVRVGDITDEQIDGYLATGEWRGKAGGYNLRERIDEGWPITVDGDPTSVMGLPIESLRRQLASFG
ncbi:MAG: Maf family protein [Planctomycetota bacterium]